MRRLLFLVLAATFAPAAAAADAVTTRIETRPFYGATVTLEEGVRVFRPLPAPDRVIINPGGQTPLSLGFEQRNIVSHNYNYVSGNTGSPVVTDGGVGLPLGYGYGRSSRHDGHRSGVHHHGGHGGYGGHGGGHR
ncbi:MAG: hypothetical protein JSS20_07640 [Proteobacteria bacterium]|nr:hypothetical protein [Pseudomonadota bacterium]